MPEPNAPRRIRTETVLSHPHIAVREHELDPAHGGPRRIVTIDLLDWVIVSATDPEGRFVLVDQHRHGIDAPTVECAGGVVDPGEQPEAAARRELLEESGFEATTLEPLGWVHPNPALHGNRAFFYFARGAVRKADPLSPPEEVTSLRLLSREAATDALAEHRITHAMSVISLERTFRALDRGGSTLAVDRVEATLGAMRDLQLEKVADLARRLRPGLSADDLKQPHDFPELRDPDFHFADGQVAGLDAAMLALRALGREREG
jgi:ADP-ribose pyrophosphatase